MGGKAESFGWYGLPRLQQKTGGERQVKENMRQNDAVQAIYRYWFQPDLCQARVQPPRSAKHRKQPQDRNNHR